MRLKTALLTATILAGSAVAAHAQNYDHYEGQRYEATQSHSSNNAYRAPSDLQLTVAVGVAAAPEYFGASDYEAVFAPAIALEYRDAFLVYDRQAMMTPYEGLGYKILSNQNWSLGVSLLADQGRQDDSKHIRGMGDVDWSVLAGGFVAYEHGPYFARGQLHIDTLGEYDAGYRGELGAGIKGQIAPDVSGMLETTARYGSENYNEAFYNVNGTQSAATGLAVHDADNGFTQWGVGGTLRYNVTPGAFVQGLARYDRALEQASKSPVVDSKNQFYLGTQVGYTF
jgi:outer membrane protein